MSNVWNIQREVDYGTSPNHLVFMYLGLAVFPGIVDESTISWLMKEWNQPLVAL